MAPIRQNSKNSNLPPGPILGGVSVVICCHNSAARLPGTIKCLREQQGTENVGWEVIVVDNACSDETVTIAQRSWSKDSPAPLRIVLEPRLGLSNARVCGLEAAQYEYVSFIDDDNRVSSDWIVRVSGRMSSDQSIGACGPNIAPDFESPPPSWWPEFADFFAVGAQCPQQGDITEAKGYLFGAGLTVRKSAWNQLRENGFRFYTSDRRGNALTGGGDNELCYALRLAGWKLWLDWELELKHLIPPQRLTWGYVRRLHRAAGGTCLTLGCYDAKIPVTLRERLRTRWWWLALTTLKDLLTHPGDSLEYVFRDADANRSVLRTEPRLGRLVELIRLRGDYYKMLQEIRNARWRNAKKQTTRPPFSEAVASVRA